MRSGKPPSTNCAVAERNNAVKEPSGKPEITQFKGQGEISPKEFAQFIGKETRLSKVEYAPARRVRPDLQLLHGQEHARAEGLHHGQAGRAGGGVTLHASRQSPNLTGRPNPPILWPD